MHVPYSDMRFREKESARTRVYHKSAFFLLKLRLKLFQFNMKLLYNLILTLVACEGVHRAMEMIHFRWMLLALRFSRYWILAFE